MAKIVNRNSEFVFINRSIDVCKFFEDKSATVLLKMIHDEMVKKGLNVNSCPIQPGMYSSRGFGINYSRFPPVLPTGRVHMKIEEFVEDGKELRPIVTIQLVATIKNNLAKVMRGRG